MNKRNFKLDLSSNKIFEIVRLATNNLGLESYVIGGFVRDLILNRPNKDIDFVTLGSGIELAKMSASLINDELKVNYFKNFGTAQFNFADFDIEFVGARKESYRSDSRKPMVENGTLDEDQKRRDFTINAMGISLNKGNFGELIDPFDGLKDLTLKIIRTPLDPEITFSDDPLRMMRAIRFASQFGFDIETETFLAIKNMKDRISIVSQERITDELNKIILSKINSLISGFVILWLLKQVVKNKTILYKYSSLISVI